MAAPEQLDRIIIGAGVTGLSAAYYAQRAGQKVQVLEAGPRAGGKIRTEQYTFENASFLLEWGADSMLSIKPEGLALAHELGLQDEIVPTRTQRHIYMLRKGRLVRMPEGLQLVVPQKLWPFVRSPLFSWRGKARMGLDLLLPRGKSASDESVAAFIRRRLGKEALDFLAEPILSGIYSSDPERQSILATFPKLRELEQQHRSLILGSLRSKRKAAPPPPSLFVTFRHGMQTLTDALAKTLGDNLALNRPVKCIRKTGEGFEVETPFQTFSARSVMLTCSPKASAALLKSLAPRAAELLGSVRLTSSGCVFLAYRKKDVDNPLSGYGILIPRTERRDTNAVTWVSSKIEGRAPEGYALLRVFFGGERNPSMMAKSDEEIAAIAAREAAMLHGIKTTPLFTRVLRANEGNPQFDVGHLDRVREIESNLPKGLQIAGCFMRGVGVPDCIKQAKEALFS